MARNPVNPYWTELPLTPLSQEAEPALLTSVHSPQSNDMSESFVNTFTRDYTYVHDRPDLHSFIVQLPG